MASTRRVVAIAVAMVMLIVRHGRVEAVVLLVIGV